MTLWSFDFFEIVRTTRAKLEPWKALGQASEEYRRLEALATAARVASKCGEKRPLKKWRRSRLKAQKEHSAAMRLADASSGLGCDSALALEDVPSQEGPPADGNLAITKATKKRLAIFGTSAELELVLQKDRQARAQASAAARQADQEAMSTLALCPEDLCKKHLAAPFVQRLQAESESVFQILRSVSDLDGVTCLAWRPSADSFPVVLTPAVPRSRFPLAVDLSSASMCTSWKKLHCSMTSTSQAEEEELSMSMFFGCQESRDILSINWPLV